MRRQTDVRGRLYATYHDVNERHFAGLLPMLPIHFIPRGKKDSQRLLLARVQWDSATGRANHIEFTDVYVERADWSHIRETLLHEMVHVWQGEQGFPATHSPVFRAQCERLGVSGRAVD